MESNRFFYKIYKALTFLTLFMEKKIFFLEYIITVLAYMSLIFYLSSRAGRGYSGLDLSLLHVPEYFILAWLWYRMLNALQGENDTFLKNHALLVAIICASLYGISDEWHQSFVPGRDASSLDVLYDVIGGSLVSVATKKISLFF